MLMKMANELDMFLGVKLNKFLFKKFSRTFGGLLGFNINLLNVSGRFFLLF
jgi:hypothetical protein